MYVQEKYELLSSTNFILTQFS